MLIAFEDLVERHVRMHIEGARSLVDLVKALPGVFPKDALDALRRIGRELPPGDPEQLELTIGPIPHPLDYDWRFTTAALGTIRDRLLSERPERVIAVTCPSVARALGGDCPIELLDHNSAWARWLPGSVNFLEQDLFVERDHCARPCTHAVVDPPWYDSEFEASLHVGARNIVSGGLVLLSFPAEGTRPNIVRDWRKVLEWATRFGLSLEDHHPNALLYATPFFEGSALLALGLPVVRAWRRADLAVFRKTGPTPTRRWAPSLLPEWGKAQIGWMDLRIRSDHEFDRERADPRLIEIVSGDVLHTVSRRDPLRSRAKVWTNGNRVFDCEAPALLASILRAIEACVPVSDAAAAALGRALSVQEQAWVTATEVQVGALEARERSDYHNLHGSDPISAAGVEPAEQAAQ